MVLQKQEERNLINNLKGILIILVVLGHIVEYLTTPVVRVSAKLIYTFHMTTFILISGYLAKNEKTNIRNLLNLIMIYLVFNTGLWFIFNQTLYLRPFWAMWYIEALIVYRFVLIFINLLKTKTKLNVNKLISFLNIITILISSFVIIKFNTYMFPDIKILKIVMYLPIFFIGYNLSLEKLSMLKEWVTNKKLGKVFVYISVIICVVLFWFLYAKENIKILYVNRSFSELNVTYAFLALRRGLLYVIGLCISLALLKVTNCKKNKIITYLGENTLSIFIIHTIIIYFLRILIDEKILIIPARYEIIFSIIGFIIVMILSSNKYVAEFFYVITNTNKKIIDKILVKKEIKN